MCLEAHDLLQSVSLLRLTRPQKSPCMWLMRRNVLHCGCFWLHTLTKAILQVADVQELMTGELLAPGRTLTSRQLQRMVTALDLAADKSTEISALEAELLQAKSKALLYEVWTQHEPQNCICTGLIAINSGMCSRACLRCMACASVAHTCPRCQ